jgi:heat shock protein HtpX
MNTFFNNFKTAGLMAAMIVLMGVVGQLIGGQNGMIIALVIAFFTNFIAYFFSDSLALSSMGAQEVNRQSAPDLVDMVARLSANAGLPMPRVYICPQEVPNAFATGRSPSKAAVAVTHGALTLLSYDELEGVMAHELAHVKNRDTLISTIAGTLAGALTMLAHWGMFMGGGQSRDKESNPLQIVGLLAAVILAPIAAAMIQMAISRSREYVADADGARIAGTPDGLMSALLKLENYSKQMPLAGAHESRSHQFIVQPLTGDALASLFSTHPRTQDRVQALAKLRGELSGRPAVAGF